MKKKLLFPLLGLAVLSLVGLSYQTGESFCVIFPANGRDIFGVSQRVILVFSEKLVTLIPQINFEGNARDFGILVPVPAQPQLAPANTNIFSEASFLTQPIVRTTGSGCACDNDQGSVSPMFRDLLAGAVVREDANQGVTVVYEQTVGTYQAAVLRATNAGDLIGWLDDNGYHHDPADSVVLGEYVAKNWFFVAMKLDTSQVPQHIDQWWSASTNPAKVTFALPQDSLQYPLKISARSAREQAEVLVYTIGPNPMRFPGARVEYANEISPDELSSFSSRYPGLHDLVREGDFITKLRRNFKKEEMQQDIMIFPSNDRREFREVKYRSSTGFGIFGVFLALLVGCLNRHSRRSIQFGRPVE